MMSQPIPSDELRQATAAAEAGAFAEAESRCRKILVEAPADPGALALLGALHARRGALVEAIASYRAALRAAPRFVKALSNLGAALSNCDEAEEAERHLTAALQEEPDYGPALINLGQLYLRQRRTSDAVALLRRAVAAVPADPLAWNNLGAACLQADRPDEALAALRSAVDLDPASAAAWSNVGNAYHRLGKYHDAVAAFRAAIARGAATAESWTHLGAALRGLDRVDEALAAHGKALALDPGLAEARFNRALLLLATGRFAEGWDDYRQRPSGRAFRARCDGGALQRLPQDLTGRRILVLTNLGFGDELFFLRFAPELKRRGASVVYRTTSKLSPLARQYDVLDGVVENDAPAPAADVELLVDDLPYALGARGTPPALPLHPDPSRLGTLRARLAACGPPPYLGVTWRGGIDAPGSLFKALPPDALGAAVAGWPGTIVVLQRAPLAQDIAAFARAAGRPAQDLSALNDDLEEMLAALSLIEDYVAVSNTNVHLRQSLGLASRVLVPMPPDWRWMAAGDRSPWFPECALYRQTAGGAWDGAFARLARELAAAPRVKG